MIPYTKSFTWEFTDKHGSKIWLVVGRHGHWWNVNIDTTSIRGERILTTACDIADTQFILDDLKSAGCEYTHEQYETLTVMGEQRRAQLEEFARKRKGASQ